MVFFHKVCEQWHFRSDHCYFPALEAAYQKRLQELEQDMGKEKCLMS